MQRVHTLIAAATIAVHFASVPQAFAAFPAVIDNVRDARLLADRIDQIIAARWATEGIQPSRPSDDAEFFRRVHLDLIGVIPYAWEVREFLEDTNADKRNRVIDRLLSSPQYVAHFTNVWRAIWLPDANNQQVSFFTPSFESWLRQRLQENAHYDRMVREILTLPLADPANRQVQLVNQGEATPVAFFQATELKPENLAASTSRLFLGVKLECAQCHDHPFAPWSRKQFWEFAAFYSGIKPQGQGGLFGPVKEDLDRHELTIPGQEKLVQAKLLDGSEPRWTKGISARETLANWTTTAGNPFFARSAANRLWAQFFGLGLIEPVDEPGDQHPPSHPELLDELSRQLASHDFDLKFLIRAITMSKTYQLSSTSGSSSQDDARLFARMPLKGLSPEQLFDSLARATGYRETDIANRRLNARRGINSPRTEFLARFSVQDKRTEVQTSILQALMLMNGRFIADATSLDRSETLAAVIDAPFLSESSQRIESLYLSTLSRKPRTDEVARLRKYVEQGSETNRKKALTDVYWILLNSTEFILNH